MVGWQHRAELVKIHTLIIVLALGCLAAQNGYYFRASQNDSESVYQAVHPIDENAVWRHAQLLQAIPAQPKQPALSFSLAAAASEPVAPLPSPAIPKPSSPASPEDDAQGDGSLLWQEALPMERTATLYVADGCEPCHRLKALLEGKLRGVTLKYNLTLHNLSDRPSAILQNGTQSPQIVIRDRLNRVVARMSDWSGVSDDELERWLEYYAAPPKAYPVGNRPWWSGCDRRGKHLLTGEHEGKFYGPWVAAQSDAAIQSLHSDDHEHTVKWASVCRPFGPQFGER